MPWGQVSSNKLKVMLEKKRNANGLPSEGLGITQFAAFQAGTISCF